MKKSEISAAFSRSAADYNNTALLQKHTGEKLFSFLSDLSIYPNNILDLGSGTGYLTKKINQKFPNSPIFSLDIAYEMLKFSSHPYSICADAENLPLKSNSISLVFSNLMLQWIPNLSQTFEEIKRIMKSDGYFIFTTLGSSTLKEWRTAWETVDEFPHVHNFSSKNTLEKKLSNFSIVFLETNDYKLTFSSLHEAMDHTRKIGASNLHIQRQRGLMGKRKWRQFISAYKTFRLKNGNFPVTYEVITCILKNSS